MTKEVTIYRTSWVLIVVLTLLYGIVGAQGKKSPVQPRLEQGVLDFTDFKSGLYDLVTVVDREPYLGSIENLIGDGLIMVTLDGKKHRLERGKIISIFFSVGRPTSAAKLPEKIEPDKDLIFLRTGEIKSGTVTAITEFDVLSTVGKLDRNHVYKILFPPKKPAGAVRATEKPDVSGENAEKGGEPSGEPYETPPAVSPAGEPPSEKELVAMGKCWYGRLWWKAQQSQKEYSHCTIQETRWRWNEKVLLEEDWTIIVDTGSMPSEAAKDYTKWVDNHEYKFPFRKDPIQLRVVHYDFDLFYNGSVDDVICKYADGTESTSYGSGRVSGSLTAEEYLSLLSQHPSYGYWGVIHYLNYDRLELTQRIAGKYELESLLSLAYDNMPKSDQIQITVINKKNYPNHSPSRSVEEYTEEMLRIPDENWRPYGIGYKDIRMIKKTFEDDEHVTKYIVGSKSIYTDRFLEDGWSRMRGSYTYLHPDDWIHKEVLDDPSEIGEIKWRVEARWDLRRVACPEPREEWEWPPDLPAGGSADEDKDCNTLLNAAEDLYTQDMLRIRGKIEEAYRKHKQYKKETLANVEGYRAAMASCGIMDVTLEYFLSLLKGAGGMGKAFVSAQEMLDKMLKGDPTWVLGETEGWAQAGWLVFKGLGEAWQAHFGSTENLRARLRSCAGKTPPGTYDAALAFINNREAAHQSAKPIGYLLSMLTQRDLERYFQMMEEYDKCVACAKEEGQDPSRCLKPFMGWIERPL